MAAPVLYKVKSATYKTKAIVHAVSAEISVEGSEQTARGDGAAATQLAYMEDVHMRISITALQNNISDKDLINPGTGSLVVVLFQQAAGSGAGTPDATYTFTTAMFKGARRGAPLDGNPTVTLDFIATAASGVIADLVAIT
jgi:hypothetical protein